MHRVVPTYLRLVTSSNFWPFMLISALMLFVLLVLILLFSVLTSIPFYRYSVCESIGEVLKFTITAAQNIDVVGKSKVAYRPSTIGRQRKRWEDNIREMDRPGVRQVPDCSGEQGKMEKKIGCKIICGAPTTLAVKRLMIMMMMT